MRTTLHIPALLGLILPSLVLAQAGGLGFKAGATYGKLLSEVMPATQALGATVGLYVPVGIGPRMELQGEVLATAVGSGLTIQEGVKYTERLIYLQVPISFKYYFSNTVNVQGGPQMGYLLKALRMGPEGAQEVRHLYNSMDVGANMGVGLDLRPGLDFTFRYHYGITPVFTNDQTFFPRNRYLQLTAGYRFAHFKVGRAVRKRS